MKALFEWLASLWYEMVEYLLDQLMELFNVDLSYFAERVPVIDDIANIFVAVGWALLIGNLAFQAMRSMVSGVGIEAEEPARLFLRTAMFSFLLLVSRQICDIGFGLSATVMEMLQVPDAITFEPFGEETFDTLPNAGWLIVIIVNVVIQWQLIRLFFEVAERYVILCALTYCAPLAFAMGGSKSTSDIFRGWLRMFASMCVLMVFNLMFVKLVLSALSTDPNGAAIIPWTMLVVGIVRMAKKMDSIILRIGMNPALTGDPLGSHFPGTLTAMTLRSIAYIVTRTAAKHTPPAGHSNTSGPPTQGNPVLRGGMAGGTAKSSSSAGRPGMASAGKGRQQPAAMSSAAAKGAGSGAQVAGTMAAFHSRYGADNAQMMREVREAISVDADDWDDESYASSSVVQSSTSQTVSGTDSRVMPPVPPIRPVPADFGHMSSPPEADDKLPPIMPLRDMNRQVGHMVSPVTPEMSMPRSSEQVPQDFSGRNPMPESSGETDSTPSRGTTQTDRTQQSGKISPVMPPPPRQMQQNRMRVENHASISGAEQPAAQPTARVTPVSPSITAGGASQAREDTVPVTSTAAVTAAATAGSMASSHTDKTRISPAREAPPQAMRPVSGNAVSPARQRTASAGRQAPSPVSARVTPSAPHKSSAQTAAQTIPPQNRAAVTPPRPSPQNQAQTASKVAPAQESTRVTPVPQAAATSDVPPQVHAARSSAKMQPDAMPADRLAVSPARRERKPEHRDVVPRPDVRPGVRTPDMITPPPTSQPHALRRSAQPLKNKVTPETPKKGGNQNRKRKRKK